MFPGSAIASLASVCLLCLHLGSGWDREIQSVPWASWTAFGAGLACGAVAYGWELSSSASSASLPHIPDYGLRSEGVLMVALVFLLLLSSAGGVLEEFALAITCTPLVILWLHVAGPLVLYECRSYHFLLTRGLTYGIVRATVAWIFSQQEESRTFLAWPRYTVLAVGTAESLGMYLGNLPPSYGFPTRSRTFLAYAAWKSCVLLAVPTLEEALLRL